METTVVHSTNHLLSAKRPKMSSLGRMPPGKVEPSFLPPSSYRPSNDEPTIHTTAPELLENLNKTPQNRPPGYLSQPEDFFAKALPPKVGPIDNWAPGREDYSPVEGYRGIHPVVDTFSISRYSLGEWRKGNQSLLHRSHVEQNRSDQLEWNGCRAIEDTSRQADTCQADNSERLVLREKEIFRWKSLLEEAIEKMRDENDAVEVERQRLKKALMMVLLPISIAKECINRRTSRIDTELVKDEVEDALAVELSLTEEIKQILEKTLRNVDNQLIENQSAYRQLQHDWSCKSKALELEHENKSLRNRSQQILFKHSAAKFPNDQSTPELWNKYIEEILMKATETRERSAKLRATLDAILIHAARDLRSQADKVERALSDRINLVDEMRRQLEIELKKVMRKIVDCETLFPKLKDSMRKLDFPLKVAQTRLDNKSLRPLVENCRDMSQYGLIEEVKCIQLSVTELQGRLKEVEDGHASLMTLRNEIERDLLLKKKSLEIDRWLVNDVRSRFPSAVELSGYAEGP